nr:ATP synthase F0 subunit 8 [Thomomys bottae]
MPQLDTSPWFMTILGTLISLFIIFQMKIKKNYFFNTPTVKKVESTMFKSSWEMKWTKIYLPHSLPLH